MRRPQISLRDLFWVVLIAAIGVGWRLEHSRRVKRLNELRLEGVDSRLNRIFPGAWNSGAWNQDEDERSLMLKEVLGLSNEELSERLSKMYHQAGIQPYGNRYHFCLSEMARRGMHRELQAQYDCLMAHPRRDRWFLRNATLLTAFRRAQGRPDSLRLHVELSRKNRPAEPNGIPEIFVTLENVDQGNEAVSLLTHSGDRSGRSENWKVRLINADGVQIPDSNFVPWPAGGGGLISAGPLPAGEKWSHVVPLDARVYVSSPPAGRYQLQVIYADHRIAGESDLSGLIVWESTPIPVDVENRSLSVSRISPLVPLVVMVGIVAAVVMFAMVRSRRRLTVETRQRRFLSWRDLLALALVATLMVFWLIDQRQLNIETDRVLSMLPDSEADWSMKQVD